MTASQKALLIFFCLDLVQLNLVRADLGHDGTMFELKSESFTGLNQISEIITEAEFGVEYNYSVNSTEGLTFLYLKFSLDKGSAVRIRVSAENATRDLPVLFVVKQQKSVLSWQIPLLPLDGHLYPNVTRTLCPLMDEYNTTQDVWIDITTMSRYTQQFSLKAEIENINLTDGSVNVTHVSPAKPKFFFYEFPDGVDSVVVMVESPDSLCSVLSVQDSSCPVYDLEHDVAFVGLRQTVTTRASISVEKVKFPSFFVVLVVKADDADCTQKGKIHTINSNKNFYEDKEHRQKTFSITVEQSISESQVITATLGALGVFLFFYLIALVVVLIHYYRVRLDPGTPAGGLERILESTNAGSDTKAAGNDGVIEVDNGPDGSSRAAPGMADDAIAVDINTDGDTDTDVNGQKENHVKEIVLADLCKKGRKGMKKKYKLYVWNLITLAIFFTQPVIQLLLTYRRVVMNTGNEDVCYYNFYCSYDLGLLTSFNSVYSNIGYVLLGILFILLVWRRDILYEEEVKKDPTRVERGIPQYFGIFYAIGVAMILEGILSASYHVCPSYNNFQFDTAFMYMIGWLCMLKIYQTRHPDINAHAHTAYCAIAVVVLIGVIGINTLSTAFGVIFIIVYVLVSLGLTVRVYYREGWSLDTEVISRTYKRIGDQKSFRPYSISRFIFLVIGNTINMAFVAIFIYGLVEPDKAILNFASLLLAIVTSNLLMYFSFYIFMKISCGEKIRLPTIFYSVCAAICWGFAFYFYTKSPTAWDKSPAMSRERNEKCLVLGFYDRHDIWHGLSSLSLFFGFMALLTLEDGLVDVSQNDIPVF